MIMIMIMITITADNDNDNDIDNDNDNNFNNNNDNKNSAILPWRFIHNVTYGLRSYHCLIFKRCLLKLYCPYKFMSILRPVL